MDNKQYNQVEIHRKKTKTVSEGIDKESEYPSIGKIIVPTKDYRVTERNLI
tara:strand:+ start:2047 stop:2199 length:153 start_codon:yes stop_codon:yes gene_type:complete